MAHFPAQIRRLSSLLRASTMDSYGPLTPGGRRAMRVVVRGPVDLEDGGRPVALGGVRQRAGLADRGLHANEVVPSEQLLVELWGEDSPPGAANALQAAVSRLRRVLPAGRLTTTAPGYMLRVFPAEFD